MRKVPVKNYFKLAILFAVTIFITLSTSLIYQNYRRNIKSYMSKNIQKVNAKELDIYLQENDYAIMYVAYGNDDSHDEESEELLKELNDIEIKKYMIFVDRRDKDNVKYIKDKFNKSVEDSDMMLLIEDGSLVKSVKLENYNISELLVLLNGDLDD